MRRTALRRARTRSRWTTRTASSTSCARRPRCTWSTRHGDGRAEPHAGEIRQRDLRTRHGLHDHLRGRQRHLRTRRRLHVLACAHQRQREHLAVLARRIGVQVQLRRLRQRPWLEHLRRRAQRARDLRPLRLDRRQVPHRPGHAVRRRIREHADRRARVRSAVSTAGRHGLHRRVARHEEHLPRRSARRQEPAQPHVPHDARRLVAVRRLQQRRDRRDGFRCGAGVDPGRLCGIVRAPGHHGRRPLLRDALPSRQQPAAHPRGRAIHRRFPVVVEGEIRPAAAAFPPTSSVAFTSDATAHLDANAIAYRLEVRKVAPSQYRIGIFGSAKQRHALWRYRLQQQRRRGLGARRCRDRGRRGNAAGDDVARRRSRRDGMHSRSAPRDG